ncbi:hypothetical protein [Asticcacaulis sp. MM231]|uniref:hypothetical protein n=1 Tax=Asticcacaulis sp. MM231 TaxID=3157666 RepID=UPI0032D57ED4
MSLSALALLLTLGTTQIAGWNLTNGHDKSTGTDNVILSRIENGRSLEFSCRDPKSSRPAVRFAYIDGSYVGRPGAFQSIIVQLDDDAPMDVIGSYEAIEHIVMPPTGVSTVILDRLSSASTVRVKVFNVHGEPVNSQFSVAGASPAIKAFKHACF